MNTKTQENKIIMLAILGICFAALGWSDVVSDLVYKKFETVNHIVFIISIIGMIHSLLCVLANFIVIHISSYNPKILFRNLLLICSILVIVVGASIFLNNLYIFTICYIIYLAFLEILSMYHFAFETSTTKNNRYILVENKRKTFFKIIQCITVVISNLFIIHYFELGFAITTGISSLVFLFIYFQLKDVVCINWKEEPKDSKETFLQKLKIKKYSTTIKKYGIATLLTRFAFSNIIILFSMNLLQNNMEFSLLKEIKNYAIIFAIIGYFAVKKSNTKGIEIKLTIFLEIFLTITILLSIWNPYFLILLMGIYTIDNLVELAGRFRIFEKDTYPENNIQKNAIMDIGIFAAQGLASIILLNIPFSISIVLVIVTIILAILLKNQCRKEIAK